MTQPASYELKEDAGGKAKVKNKEFLFLRIRKECVIRTNFERSFVKSSSVFTMWIRTIVYSRRGISSPSVFFVSNGKTNKSNATMPGSIALATGCLSEWESISDDDSEY